MIERSDQPTELASGKLILDWPVQQVARLQLVNVAKRNALDHEMLDAISVTVPQIEAKCLIVTGHDKVFSAGYDIGGIQNDVFAREAEKLVAHPFTDAIEALESWPYPTIAALNGHAIGGGLEVALACDLRIAADDIHLGMPPAKLGLVYSHTGLAKFIATIGPARTRELFFTGANITADRADAYGLVNNVVARDQLEDETLKTATTIAGNAPLSLKGNKRVIRALLDGPLAEELERELIELRRSCFVSEDFREGVRSFEEKRAPEWRGR